MYIDPWVGSLTYSCGSVVYIGLRDDAWTYSWGSFVYIDPRVGAVKYSSRWGSVAYVSNIDPDGSLTGAWAYCAELRELGYDTEESVDATEVRFMQVRG